MIMSGHPIEEKQKKIIKRGYELLKREKCYRQVNVVNKIMFLKYQTSKAAFSKILSGKKAGSDSLWNNSKGIEQVVYKELGYQFNGVDFVENKQDWKELIVPEFGEHKESNGLFFFEKGRLSIAEKAALYTSGRKVIYEFGIALRTYSDYFFSRKKSEIKTPVINLLKKGVTIKCFVLEPECNEAGIYFNDRAKVRGFEEEAFRSEKIKESVRKFSVIQEEFSEANYIGKFEVYKYRHIPTSYFMAIDPEEEYGTIVVSHYLYGQLRAHNPVMKVTRQDNPSLYENYWNSLKQSIAGAKLIDKAKK